MSINEYFYKGVNIILQVYGEQEYQFRGFMFLDTDDGVITQRIAGDNRPYRSSEEAFQYGFEFIKKVVDNNLHIN